MDVYERYKVLDAMDISNDLDGKNNLFLQGINPVILDQANSRFTLRGGAIPRK